MICSWSLLHDVLEGTLDEEYPIFKSAEEGQQWVKENGGYEYTPLPGRPLDTPKEEWKPDKYIYESPDRGKTIFRRKHGETQREQLINPKPKPDLENHAHRKYEEDKGLKDLSDYVASTYSGHYTNEGSNVQTLDLIHSVGDAESFCRSNAIKYLSRYDKKGQAKRDILKAMHYCLLLYYFSGNTNDEITTRGYETF